jgi:hypothetical protein
MSEDFAIQTQNAADRALDRLGIADAAYIYGAAVDLIGANPIKAGDPDPILDQAAELFGQAMHDDARLRLFLAGPSGPSQPLGPGGPAGVAQAVRTYFTAYGYIATQHLIGNVRACFTGADTAVATSLIPCFHWLVDGRMLLAPVSYRDEYQRAAGVWKIATRDIFAMKFWVAEGYEPNPLDPTMARLK